MMQEIHAILQERFHKDSLVALATASNNVPAVRTVNAFYEEGAFYIITWAKSGKMQQIAHNPAVALCGNWFTGQGTAENLGHVLLPENAAMLDELRTAFAAWYGNGHVNESDPDTILLRVRLTGGVVFAQGKRYEW